MNCGRKSFYIALGIHSMLLLVVLLSYLFNAKNPIKAVDAHVFEMLPVAALVPMELEKSIQESIFEQTIEVVKTENLMSYEDFIKQQGNFKKVKSKVRKQEVVDTQKIKESLSKALHMDEQRLDIAHKSRIRSLQAAYLSKLKQRIDGAWDKPKGVVDELRAQVVFRVLENGSIVEVKVVKSSGNASFDASILEAFDYIERMEMPKEVANIYELVFSMGS